MKRLTQEGDALNGQVSLSLSKTCRNLLCLAIGTYGVVYFDSTFLVATAMSFITMYIGVVAYHRLLIHRSFKCPSSVEHLLVFLANVSGMSGPISLMKTHEMRDWAQRQKVCHPYFSHKNSILTDGFQQLFCKITLQKTPIFNLELEKDAFYQHLESCWFLYQIPLGILLYSLGGWGWVCGGIFLKMFNIQFGHWLVAHLIHHFGQQPQIMPEAGVQGYNIPLLALFTFGESYHNNHHSCPEAAKNSFRKGEIDPAWWFIALLQKLGLASQIITCEERHTANHVHLVVDKLISGSLTKEMSR